MIPLISKILKRSFQLGVTVIIVSICNAQSILIPMDLSQTDHLKAYGVAYWTLEQGVNVEWLLNYRSGSFLAPSTGALERLCRLRGITYELKSAGEVASIYGEIERNNMERILLEKAPEIAVYVPPNFQPWDDAVTLALEYAEIPYDRVFDEEVLGGKLYKYDWLHLHHEDFTGQYGKFYALYRGAKWYIEQQALYEEIAHKLGYATVQAEKKAVARAIKDYTAKGGFLFAMCSATDSYDVALAAEGVDIAAAVFDGTPFDPAEIALIRKFAGREP